MKQERSLEGLRRGKGDGGKGSLLAEEAYIPGKSPSRGYYAKAMIVSPFTQPLRSWFILGEA